MKETYPKSNTWPYVLSGVLLFCLMLLPTGKWWERTTRQSANVMSSLVVEESSEPGEYGVIKVARAGEPVAKSPRVWAGARRLLAADGVLIADESYDEALQISPADSSDENSPPVTSREVGIDFSELETILDPVIAAETKVVAPDVWSPPANWVAAPIQPLQSPAEGGKQQESLPQLPANEFVAVDESLDLMPGDSTPQPMVVETRPPVATRVERSSKFEVPAQRPSKRNRSAFDQYESAAPSQTERSNDPLNESQDEGELDEVDSPEPQEIQRPVETPNPLKIEANPVESDPPESNPVAPIPAKPRPKRTKNYITGTTPDPADLQLWPKTKQLHNVLGVAEREPLLKDWCKQIETLLRPIELAPVSGSRDQQIAVARLQQFIDRPVDRAAWTPLQRQLYNRVYFSVKRRTDVWRPLLIVATTHQRDQQQAIETLAATSRQLHQHLGIAEQLQSWSEHLQLQSLASVQYQDQSAAQLAMEATLEKLSRNLSPQQQAFLNRPPFRKLERDIQRSLASIVSPADLMTSIENYEADATRENSSALLDQLRRWRSSPDSDRFLPTLQAIQVYYRNANLRLAVSEDLINRFVPAFHRYAEQVNDTILGADVRGKNATLAALQIKLIPDAQSLRFGLMANGSIQTNTESRKGPVRIFNQGDSVFSAGKELRIRQDGIFMTKTETKVSTGNKLLGIQSDLDSFPLIGWIVRNVARQQHDEQRPFLRAEVVRRVKRSTTQRLDHAVQQRLANVEQNISEKMIEPLRKLNLDPKAIEMRTTNSRIILRSRLASPLQLGAHTPRPQARADSKMSVQVHQTAANNWIEQLNLHGRRMTLEELSTALSQRTGLHVPLPQESYKSTVIQFADAHPLEFDFAEGQITLTIHLAELKTEERKWSNFSVRGYYRADVQQLDVALVREEGIELISDKLRLRDQIALRSIFTKVLAKNTRLEVLRNAILQQPKLQSLVVTQFSIRDGWMALSLGEDERGIRMVEKSTTTYR